MTDIEVIIMNERDFLDTKLKNALKESTTERKIVSKLKSDIDVLLTKLSDSLTNGEFGTYKNLVSAIKGNLEIIKELSKDDYELMYSQYSTTIDGMKIPQVAVWEQNSDGDIRNHKTWNVAIDGLKDWERNILDMNEDGQHEFRCPRETFRGLGKTRFLINQALENDGIYVCYPKQMFEAISKEYPSLRIVGGTLGEQFIHNNIGDAFVPNSTLYIDEGVDLSKVDHLIKQAKNYIAFVTV